MPIKSTLLTFVAFTTIAQLLHADENLVQFDVPTYLQTSMPNEAGLVDVQITVSSFVQDANNIDVEQWVIKVQPRDMITIADYAPKTSASSETDGGIKIKQTSEDTQAFGLGLKSDLANFADGNFGVDRGQKELFSQEYSLLSPVQTVTASGTINRGRGVYFKWRRTPNQVLEGDKTFRLTLQADDSWSGSLLDISVKAYTKRRAFGTLDQQMVTVGHSEFAVPVIPQGNAESKSLALQLARAERHLRELADQAGHSSVCEPSLSSILHSVASKLEFDSPPNDIKWVDRLVCGHADAYVDEKISRLPMHIRRAAINYQKQRQRFLHRPER